MLLSRLHATATNASAVSSAAIRQKRVLSRLQQQEENGIAGGGHGASKVEGDPSFRPDSPFPWTAAGVAIVCGAIYYKISNVVAVGMFVPIVNGVFFVCLAVFAFYKLKANRSFESGHGRGRHGARGTATRGGGSRRRARGEVNAKSRSTYLFG